MSTFFRFLYVLFLQSRGMWFGRQSGSTGNRKLLVHSSLTSEQHSIHLTAPDELAVSCRVDCCLCINGLMLGDIGKCFRWLATGSSREEYTPPFTSTVERVNIVSRTCPGPVSSQQRLGDLAWSRLQSAASGGPVLVPSLVSSVRRTWPGPITLASSSGQCDNDSSSSEG